MWGGRTKDFKGNGDVVNIYQPYTESWDEQRLKGHPPPWLYIGASASASHNLYLYGGHDGSDFCYSLYQINTKSLVCSEVRMSNGKGGPVLKRGCRIVTYGEDQLQCIGGYAFETPSGIQPKLEDNSGHGWSSEHHSLHLKEGKGWEWPISAPLSSRLFCSVYP